MGGVQGTIGKIFPIDDMLKNLALVGMSPAYLLAKFFENDFNFGAGASAYIFIDGIIKEIKKFIF